MKRSKLVSNIHHRSNKPRIANYIFPNYYPDARNTQIRGPGWTEWELVKRAEPRFTGRNQPRVPLWGYEDEANSQGNSEKDQHYC